MTHKNYTRNEIADVCRSYGSLLKVPAGIDGATLLYALSGNESDFGANCKPRFEPAYFSGRYAKAAAQAQLNAEYGEDAAKSYGPWQVMLINAPGFAPDELAEDLEKACTATVGYINRYVLTAQKAVTLEEIADTFNSGNWRDANVPHVYISNFLQHYVVGLPPLALAATGGVIHP